MLGLILMALTAVLLAAILGVVWLAVSAAMIEREQDEHNARIYGDARPTPPQPTAFSREAAHPDRVGYPLHPRRALRRYVRHLETFAPEKP